MKIYIWAHKKEQREVDITSIDEVPGTIRSYCADHKIDCCDFKIEGNAMVKVDYNSLQALFG